MYIYSPFDIYILYNIIYTPLYQGLTPKNMYSVYVKKPFSIFIAIL